MIVTGYGDLVPLVAAIRRGAVVAIPTDTVYGLACAAHDEAACERLLLAKGRDLGKPSAIVCGSLDGFLAGVVPEVLGRAAVRARALLPGPVTVVLPNPGRRFRWLCGDAPDRIGLRVPVLDPRLAAAIDAVPALLLTSANAAGEPPATSLAELAAVACLAEVAVDGGPSPGGRASTVVDLVPDDPVVLREGPVALDEIRVRLGLA